MSNAHWEACESEKRLDNEQEIRICFNHAIGHNPEENALLDWIRMMVDKNWPVTSVKDRVHRFAMKHARAISHKRICMMIILLGEILEDKITTQLEINIPLPCLTD